MSPSKPLKRAYRRYVQLEPVDRLSFRRFVELESCLWDPHRGEPTPQAERANEWLQRKGLRDVP